MASSVSVDEIKQRTGKAGKPCKIFLRFFPTTHAVLRFRIP